MGYPQDTETAAASEASPLMQRNNDYGSQQVAEQESETLRSSSTMSRISRTSDRFTSMVIREAPAYAYVEDKLMPDPMKYMLVFVLIGFIANLRSWGAFPVFWFNALGILPLGLIQSHLTKVMTLGKTAHAFIFHNVLRNAIELILALAALYYSNFRLLKAFLLGSMICNQLVVAGVQMIFLAFQDAQEDDEELQPTDASFGLLWLITSSLLIPSSVSFSTIDQSSVIWMSRFCGCMLLILYECILISEISRMPSLGRAEDIEEDRSDSGLDAAMDEENFSLIYEEIIENRVRPGEMKPGLAGLLLLLTLTAICYCCSAVIRSAPGAAMAIGVPPELIAFALLPFLGNTTEFLNLGINRAEAHNSVGNAIGSAILIGLLIYPGVVVLGWIMDKPLSFAVTFSEGTSILITTTITSCIYGARSVTWIKGAALVFIFLIFCLSTYYEYR